LHEKAGKSRGVNGDGGESGDYRRVLPNIVSKGNRKVCETLKGRQLIVLFPRGGEHLQPQRA